MSGTPPPEEKKRIEVDIRQLKELLDTEPEETRDTIREQINRYDRSHQDFQLRDKTTQLYQQRGLNVQQHSIMKGFMKWQGTLFQLAYNLSLGLSISLGGIDKAVASMREKSWLERNGALLVILLVGSAVYFGFIYSPDFRLWLTTFFAPVTTQIALAIILIALLYLWYRSRRKAQQG